MDLCNEYSQNCDIKRFIGWIVKEESDKFACPHCLMNQSSSISQNQAISRPVRRISLTKGLSLYNSDKGKAYGSINMSLSYLIFK